MNEDVFKNERWRQSLTRPIWWISNLGRVRGNGRWGEVKTLRWNPLLRDYCVLARGENRYYKIRELYEEVWGYVEPGWVPNLERATPRKGNRTRSPILVIETGDIYETAQEVADALEVSLSAVTNHLCGLRHHVAGYHLRRKVWE